MSESEVPVSTVPIPADEWRSVAEVLLEHYPDVYGHRIGGEPANIDGTALGRDAQRIGRALLDAGWSGPNPEPCHWCEHRRDRHDAGGCHDGACRCTMPHGGS